jgi:hypothetical protein
MMLAIKESNQKLWNPNNCPAYFSANYGQWSSYQYWYDWVHVQSQETGYLPMEDGRVINPIDRGPAL